MADQRRGGNPNWKGGRVIASNGYVLLRMPGHHLADVRGYVYEHRLVGEQILGRRLQLGEIPHHKNGRKTDNRPENIEVMPSIAHHQVHHRLARDCALRLPDEPNPIVACACDCGGLFSRYDSLGRPRRYISGHNPHVSERIVSILDALRLDRRLHRSVLAARIGVGLHAVAVALSKGRARGLFRPVGRGDWELV